MRINKIFVIVVALVVFIILFMPLWIGRYIQNGASTCSFFSGLQNSSFEILEYHRGWFHSDAVCRVKIKNANIHHLFETIAAPKVDIPDALVLTVHEHIFHGPIFYENKFKWRKLGIALIDRKFIISPEQKKFFATLGINDETIQDRTYINFTGSVLENIKLEPLSIKWEEMQIKIASIQADIWQSLLSHRIYADFILSQVSVENEGDSLSLPQISLQLNVKNTEKGLWVGWLKLSLPELTVLEDEKKFFDLRELKVESELSAQGDFLDFENKLSYEKLDFDKQSFGRFQFDATLTHLSAQAFKDLVDVYQHIREHGELYESQLQRKMMAMLPNLIIPGTTLEIKDFNLATNTGGLKIQGLADWGVNNNISANDLAEIAELSNLNGSVRVSIPLIKELIENYADLSYVYQLPLTERLKLIAIQNTERSMSRQYANMMIELIKERKISDEDGTFLVILARSRMPLDEYLKQIKSLLLARKISLEVSYLLGWQYAEFSNQKKMFEQKLEHSRQTITKDLTAQIHDYLNKGYISIDKNDYVTSIERKDGILKMNGKIVSE